MTQSPPKLLAGATLIFWGVLTGNALLGVIAALMIEGRHWLNTRWDFRPTSYVRAWHFSILLGVIFAGLAWMSGMKLGQIHRLFVWAPMIMLPIELAQRYGKANSIPLNTFSFFARRKMLEEERQGIKTRPRMLNTGYPYIMLAMLATSVTAPPPVHYLSGLVVVFGVSLWFIAAGKGRRPLAWCVSYSVAMLAAYAVLWGMHWAYESFSYRGGGDEGRRTFTHESRTSIGRLGKLKLSPRIFWRMQVQHGDVPRLMRTAVYNRYSQSRWIHAFDDRGLGRRDEFDYLGAEPLPGERDIRIFREDTETPAPLLDDRAHIIVTGELPAKLAENPVPVSDRIVAVGDLRELGEDTAIECNSLGTVRLTNSDHAVISYTLWHGQRDTTELPPTPRFDLAVPPDEQAAVRRIADQLGLADINDTARKIERIREFFNEEFRYSTHLETPAIDRSQRRSSVGIFLETTRSGHCEYFATATALLLRDSGVPARYCVGFSVAEEDRDRNEWVMRGTHSHAWCRVWMGDHWEDVDLTPPSWLALDTGGEMGWKQKLADGWQRFTEDFLIWRTRGANQTKVTVVVATIVTLLLAWIGWRLWRSRSPSVRKYNRRRKLLPSDSITDLHRLEPWLSKRIGHRPDSMPIAVWLRRVAPPQAAAIAEQAATLHDQIRFDPNAGSELSAQLKSQCLKLKAELRS